MNVVGGETKNLRSSAMDIYFDDSSRGYWHCGYDCGFAVLRQGAADDQQNSLVR